MMNKPNSHVAHGFAAKSAGRALERWEYELPPLGPDNIRVEITHCGVCHSDLDIIDNTWSDAQYPIIPGHEIIGVVTEMGQNVSQLKLGQRVGVCWQQAHCGHCHYCEAEQTHYCPKLDAIGIGHQGGFADVIQVKQTYVCAIPNELTSASAAPLLCAGATVFHALSLNKVKAGMHIGVIGIGGLGHLAIQFASKMGCKVTAFDRNSDKKDDCLAFGADTFIDCTQAEALGPYQDSFDLLLATADTAIDLTAFIPLLRAEKTFCFAGMPKVNMPLPLFELIIGSKSINAVNIGNPENVAKTLAFSARHGIAARVESLPINNVNEAIERLRKHAPRYRIVLACLKT